MNPVKIKIQTKVKIEMKAEHILLKVIQVQLNKWIRAKILLKTLKVNLINLFNKDDRNYQNKSINFNILAS